MTAPETALRVHGFLAPPGEAADAALAAWSAA